MPTSSATSMVKIEVGDKLHLEVTVVHNDPNYAFMKVSREALTPSGERSCPIEFSLSRGSPAIIKHIPKPWEPGVGDKATIKHGYYSGVPVRIVSIEEGQAWTKPVDAGVPAYGTIVALTNLEQFQ